jgi:hypothetical protein
MAHTQYRIVAGAENRPSGWSTWVTFSISPAAPEPPPAPTYHK